MNSINESVTSDILANTLKNGKERAARYYLYIVGLYIIFVFNEFIKRPVDYLALGLIIAGLPLINQNNINLLRASILQSVTTKIFFSSLAVMSALFFLATIKQLPQYDGLIAFAAQYGVHVGLAGMALLIVPINDKTINFLFDCLLLALFALVFTDIVFYIWDIIDNIEIGSNYSHRWFGDGYVFLTPFLLTRMLTYYDQNVSGGSDKPLSTSLFFQLSLYLLLFLVVVLAGGTGARSTYLILVCEILFFFVLLSRRRRWSWWVMFLGSLLLFLIIKTAFGFLAPDLFRGAISQGFRVWDRVLYSWGPGIEFALDAPLFGHGFGVRAWDAAFERLQSINPEIANYGSTHNWFLAAAFFGGVLAAIAQVCFTLCVLIYALNILIYHGKPRSINLRGGPQKLLMANLISFIIFYLIRGLVEFTIYKYLGILLLNFGVIFVLNSFKSHKVMLSQ